MLLQNKTGNDMAFAEGKLFKAGSVLDIPNATAEKILKTYKGKVIEIKTAQAKENKNK